MASRGLAWRRPGAKKVWAFERKVTCASRLAAHEDCFPAVDALKARIRRGSTRRRHSRGRGRPSRKDSPPGSLRSHGGRPPSPLRVIATPLGKLLTSRRGRPARGQTGFNQRLKFNIHRLSCTDYPSIRVRKVQLGRSDGRKGKLFNCLSLALKRSAIPGVPGTLHSNPGIIRAQNAQTGAPTLGR